MTSESASPEIYSPSAILHWFNNAISINQTKKLIQIKDVFQPGKGALYNGAYYDTIKNEVSGTQLIIIIPALLRNTIEPIKTVTLS